MKVTYRSWASACALLWLTACAGPTEHSPEPVKQAVSALAAAAAAQASPGSATGSVARRSRKDPNAQDQKVEFMLNGDVIDVCGASPCYVDGYTGP